MIRLPSFVELAREYSQLHGLSRKNAATLVSRAGQLAESAGSSDIAACCCESVLNNFLSDYAATHSAATVKGMRGDLLTVWRYAANCGLADAPQPVRVFRRAVPLTCPECYTLEEVRQLLADAQRMREAAYWEAAIRIGWATGLRRGDVLRCTADQIRPGGLLVTVVAKTGSRVIHQLDALAVASLRRVRSLAWNRPEWKFCAAWRKLRDFSVGRGTYKWLRRASGSYVAAEFGEAIGAQHLGHTSVSTFRCYYDARLVSGSRPAPPELG